jgi:hypothetical protein
VRVRSRLGRRGTWRGGRKGLPRIETDYDCVGCAGRVGSMVGKKVPAKSAELIDCGVDIPNTDVSAMHSLRRVHYCSFGREGKMRPISEVSMRSPPAVLAPSPSRANLPHARPDLHTLGTRLLAYQLTVSRSLAQCILVHMCIAALALFPSEEPKPRNHDEPVEVVRDDRAVGSAVLPSEQRVEDAPTPVAVLQR